MIKFGIIGTNWITGQFVDAAIATKEWELTGVYSRTVEKAKEFGEPYGATVFETNLQNFATNKEIDAVYIASPNSLHFEQAVAVMKAGKHVIVEKPIFSNPDEWEAAAKVAQENGVLMFEAARHIHEANFQTVKEKLALLGDIQGATFTYMKYSSRYDQVLAGEEPNIFSLKFSGGALADLGVYLLYSAIAWFGVPEKVAYHATKVRTGVDGKGTMVLSYPTFDATLITGKMVQSYLPSEIYGLDGTLLLDGVNAIGSIAYEDRKTGERQTFGVAPKENPMEDEAKAFADVINHPETPENQKKYASWLQLSKDVSQVMKKLRDDADIVFEADK